MYLWSVTFKLSFFFNLIVDLRGKVLVAGAIQAGGFCEKLLEAFPMSDRANTSQLQDAAAAGQGQASQQRW